jgi:hypothetical protein
MSGSVDGVFLQHQGLTPAERRSLSFNLARRRDW